MSNNFGTDFLLSQDSGLDYEILRKCNYYVDIQGIDSRLACQDTVIPKIMFEQKEIFFYNDRIKLASSPNPENLTVDVLDFLKPRIVDQLYEWCLKIYDPETRKMGYATDYKRSAMILVNDPGGVRVRTWKISGLFPLGFPVPGDPMSYEAGQEPVKVAMEFSVDSVVMVRSTAA